MDSVTEEAFEEIAGINYGVHIFYKYIQITKIKNIWRDKLFEKLIAGGGEGRRDKEQEGGGRRRRRRDKIINNHSFV